LYVVDVVVVKLIPGEAEPPNPSPFISSLAPGLVVPIPKLPLLLKYVLVAG